MMILAGSDPLRWLYFLRALAMAGHIKSSNSCCGDEWICAFDLTISFSEMGTRFEIAFNINTYMNFVKVLFILATTAPTDFPLCSES